MYRSVYIFSHSVLLFNVTVDNAAMIAWASMDRFLAHDHDSFAISLRPTWKIEDLTEPDSVDKAWHGRRSRTPNDSVNVQNNVDENHQR